MFASRQNFLVLYIYFVSSIESASIHKKNDTLDILRSDVSQVSGAIENLTFDAIRKAIEDSGEETTTPENPRSKRSADDSIEAEVQHLCQRRCEAIQKIEAQQIRDLKGEMKKLRDVVRLLQKQQKIMDTLDKENATQRSEESASEELSKMKIDLKEVIDSLNQTKEIMDLQEKKDEILEQELEKQKEEIRKLKTIVGDLAARNETEERNSTRASSGDSDLSGFRRLLKSLPEDDDLRTKILDLQRALVKKKKDETLETDLKQLEDTLKDTNGADRNLLRLIIDAVKKTEPKSRSEDVDITNLSELSDAINHLRQKEDDSVKFQAMLNSLVSRPVQQQITFTPQQMSELTKKLAPKSSPYICVVEDEGTKSRGYRLPVDYPRNQFFPGQNYFPAKGADGAGYDQPGGHQQQNADAGQYREDLRQQIDGLQATVDGLNRPEYFQRPEDKAMVADLEHQIGDLRNIVNTLNDHQRLKRSLDTNEVGNSEEIFELIDKFQNLTDDQRRNELNSLHFKVENLKQRLSTNSSRGRAAAYPPPLIPLAAPNDLERSFKNDFLAEIIGKILEKILNALPAVVSRLFSFSLDELSKRDPQDYDVQVLSKNLGVLAFLPIILLRLLKGVAAFLGMLRKNAFFKNFLLPALILGTVAGSVLFLIWWLQPEEAAYQNAYPGGDGADPNQYSNAYQSSYNYPVYNRSYFNK